MIQQLTPSVRRQAAALFGDRSELAATKPRSPVELVGRRVRLLGRGVRGVIPIGGAGAFPRRLSRVEIRLRTHARLAGHV